MTEAVFSSRQRACVAATLIALLAGVAAGCGGSNHIRTISTPHAQQGVSFAGRSIPWTLWANAGPNPYSADLYLIKGSLSRAQRITSSPRGLGISIVTAAAGRVIVSHPRFFGDVDELEQLDLSRRGGLPGRWTASGQGPVLSPDGRLAYVVPYWHNDRTIDVIVRDRISGREHRVFSTADYNDVRGPTPTWGPHDRLALTAGRTRSPLIVVDPGPREREFRGPVGMSDALFTPSGELSYQTDDRLVLRSVSGQVIRTLSMHGWQLRCWAPDGKAIVATSSTRTPGGKLGVLDPRSDSVSTLGSYSHGFLYQVICPGGSG